MHLLAAAMVLACSWWAQTSKPAEPRTVRIRQRSGPMWPWSDLKRHGLDVLEVPDADNAAWEYIRAINACRVPPDDLWEAWSYAVAEGWPGEPAAGGLTEFLRVNKEAIEITRRASRMGQCQLPYLGRPDEPLAALNFAALPGMRYLMRMMAANARCLEAGGRHVEAMEDVLVSMRVACHLGRGVGMWEHEVANVALLRALGQMRRLALAGRLPEQALAGAIQALGALESQAPSPSRMIAADRAIVLDTFELTFERPELIGLSWTADSVGGWRGMNQRLVRMALPDQTMRRQIEKMYAHLAHKATMPTPKAEWASRYRHKLLVANVPMWNRLARRHVQAVADAAVLYDRVRCDWQMTRVILALQLYRQRRSEWPEQLEAIEGELGGEVPTDAYSGKAYHYRVENSGWVLYSVGENYVDDGGKLGEGGVNYSVDLVRSFPLPEVEPFAGRMPQTQPAAGGEATK